MSQSIVKHEYNGFQIEYDATNIAFRGSNIRSVLNLDWDTCPITYRAHEWYTLSEIETLKALVFNEICQDIADESSERLKSAYVIYFLKFEALHHSLVLELDQIFNQLSGKKGFQEVFDNMGSQGDNSFRRKNKQAEAVVANKLAQGISGRREVETPSGRIDVLTDNEVIEVKNSSLWKNAVGQVLAYAQHFPLHTPRIHLFGKPINLADVKHVCATLGITVTAAWEQEQ